MQILTSQDGIPVWGSWGQWVQGLHPSLSSLSYYRTDYKSKAGPRLLVLTAVSLASNYDVPTTRMASLLVVRGYGKIPLFLSLEVTMSYPLASGTQIIFIVKKPRDTRQIWFSCRNHEITVDHVPDPSDKKGQARECCRNNATISSA